MPTHRPKLEHALLGLIASHPASGYDVRKVFQDTPFGIYSDSPGSIYPALRRLQARGLITARRAQGARGRRTLSIAPKGRALLMRWLETPLTLEQVARDAGEVDLRLAFLSDHVRPDALTAFLRTYASLLGMHRENVAAARRELANQLSASARLALDLGLTTIDARIAWCRRVLRRQPVP